MPRKSVREMSRWERYRHSLASRTRLALISMAVILGGVAFAIGFATYWLALNGQYITLAHNISSGAVAIIQETADPVPYVRRIYETYQETPEELRLDQTSGTYRNQFRSIENEKQYQQIMAILRFLTENNDVSDVYLTVYDPENSRVIYIADPDDTITHCAPGSWDYVSQKEVETFVSPDGKEIPHIFSNNEKYGWLCISGEPIRAEDGTVVGFVQTDINVWDLIANLRQFAFRYASILVALTIVLTWFFVRHFKKTMVTPINQIAEAAETYVKDRRSGSDNTDHFSRKALNIYTGDEVENLSLVMADMERDLNEYEENLTRITAEKERIGTELALATRIQADMLPNIFPAFPDRPEFDVYASMDPAKEVGGDFYDFFLIDEDHLGLVIADVSGKGVPAALFMMASKMLLNNFSVTGRSPARILEMVNNQICSNNREEMFVTVWLGILEISTGKLTAANAGHEFPALRRSGGGFELFKDKHGFVIGGMEGMKYKEYEILLFHGDKLFVYTDGVAEATDGENQMFGTDRMLAALNTDPEAPPNRILRTVRTAVDDFVRGAPQFDDLTMLCLEYIGINQSNIRNQGGNAP